jgi:hypothetical protein
LEPARFQAENRVGEERTPTAGIGGGRRWHFDASQGQKLPEGFIRAVPGCFVSGIGDEVIRVTPVLANDQQFRVEISLPLRPRSDLVTIESTLLAPGRVLQSAASGTCLSAGHEFCVMFGSGIVHAVLLPVGLSSMLAWQRR